MHKILFSYDSANMCKITVKIITFSFKDFNIRRPSSATQLAGGVRVKKSPLKFSPPENLVI